MRWINWYGYPIFVVGGTIDFIHFLNPKKMGSKKICTFSFKLSAAISNKKEEKKVTMMTAEHSQSFA
jgi:hypothetical protein